MYNLVLRSYWRVLFPEWRSHVGPSWCTVHKHLLDSFFFFNFSPSNFKNICISQSYDLFLWDELNQILSKTTISSTKFYGSWSLHVNIIQFKINSLKSIFSSVLERNFCYTFIFSTSMIQILSTPLFLRRPYIASWVLIYLKENN